MKKINILRVQRVLACNGESIKFYIAEANTNKEEKHLRPYLLTIVDNWQEVLQVVAERREAGPVGLVYNKKIVW